MNIWCKAFGHNMTPQSLTCSRCGYTRKDLRVPNLPSSDCAAPMPPVKKPGSAKVTALARELFIHRFTVGDAFSEAEKFYREVERRDKS